MHSWIQVLCREYERCQSPTDEYCGAMDYMAGMWRLYGKDFARCSIDVFFSMFRRTWHT